MRIFLTSDLHLGMKFAGYPGVQAELSEARFKALGRLVAQANEHHADLFVVAGDLFDRVTIARRDIVRAAQMLKDFQGRLVAILPGNHDFISRGQTDLWTGFKEHAGDRVLLLEEEKIYSLLHYDLDVHAYPAPCSAKHSSRNGVGWIKEAAQDRAIPCHLGIAHGSLEGFSPDFEEQYYPMTAAELSGCGLDLWLMGHTHSQYPLRPGEQDRIFYPGTPEPDGFDCSHEGKAWLLDLSETRAVHALSLSTGTYRFTHDEAEVRNPGDFEALRKKYEPPEYRKTLLKMKLTGKLPGELYRTLTELHKKIEELLFYLAWDESNVSEEITVEGIRREFTEGSFPYALLTALAQSGDSEALQIAHEMLQEERR